MITELIKCGYRANLGRQLKLTTEGSIGDYIPIKVERVLIDLNGNYLHACFESHDCGMMPASALLNRGQYSYFLGTMANDWQDLYKVTTKYRRYPTKMPCSPLLQKSFNVLLTTSNYPLCCMGTSSQVRRGVLRIKSPK